MILSLQAFRLPPYFTTARARSGKGRGLRHMLPGWRPVRYSSARPCGPPLPPGRAAVFGSQGRKAKKIRRWYGWL
ncbi:MAG TPA: hypothetical protein DEA73_08755 [Peptococcaceae bacterium]|nr:hypothetical protein [Peptococcaceae bacterium]